MMRIQIAILALLTSACAGPLGSGGGLTPLTGIEEATAPPPYRAAWRLPLYQHGLAIDTVYEFSTPAYDEGLDRLWVGTGFGRFVAIDAKTGTIVWEQRLPGGVNSEILYSEGRLYVGTDGGELQAIDAEDGSPIWSYRVKGPIMKAPIRIGNTVVVVDGTNTVYAIDATSGEWQWQYRRELPGHFATFGEAAPTAHLGRLHLGFSDGYIVTLDAFDGSVIWLKSLASGKVEFTDVDAQPTIAAGRLYVASISGGLHALDPATGEAIWTAPLEGVVRMKPYGDDLIAVDHKGQLFRIDTHTHKMRWQVTFDASAGNLSDPVISGETIAVTLSRGSLFLLDGATGEPRYEFDPGLGLNGRIAKAPAGRIFALSNGGVVYGFREMAKDARPSAVTPLVSSPGRGVF